MADSKIEWTDKTWNPVIGCSKVSEGCRNCYAMRMEVCGINITVVNIRRMVIE